MGEIYRSRGVAMNDKETQAMYNIFEKLNHDIMEADWNKSGKIKQIIISSDFKNICNLELTTVVVNPDKMTILGYKCIVDEKQEEPFKIELAELATTDRIVKCIYCDGYEYWGNVMWLNGRSMCRNCYVADWEKRNKRVYKWDDLRGPRPTKLDYDLQEANR